ncbi:acyltransferase domain-containing protein [Streptomyces zhihengii]
MLEQNAVFRDTVAECDAVLAPLTGWSVLKVLRGEEDVHGPDALPCTLFATYLGLAALWQSWGVEPAAVVGDAHGEVAAAVVSGALSLEDGARVVAHRARASSGDAAGGAMPGIVPAVASVPFRSRLTGEAVPGTELGGDYWLRGLPEPEPMRLDRALERLRGEGFGVFLDVGMPSAAGGVGPRGERPPRCSSRASRWTGSEPSGPVAPPRPTSRRTPSSAAGSGSTGFWPGPPR